MNRQMYNDNISCSRILLKPDGHARLVSSNPDSLSHLYGTGEVQDGMRSVREKALLSPGLSIKEMVDLMMQEPQDGIGFARLAGIVEERISSEDDDLECERE
jgi:hypothetical protein